MPIKGVVFDVGQTLSNQLDKENLFERMKKYYEGVFEMLFEREFGSVFPSVFSYSKQEFASALDKFNRSVRNQKNTSIEMYSEYRLAEQVLQVLVNFENTLLEKDLLAKNFSYLLEEIDRILEVRDNLEIGVYELWPDTEQVLQELKQRNFVIGLASNTAHPVKHNFMLEKLGIKKYIDHHAISSYIGVRKPNPRMLEILCEMMGLSKDEVVVVGDLLDRDILMGNLGGAKTIWINAKPYSLEQNLKRLRDPLPEYLPDAGICCLSQLLPTIEYFNHQTPNTDQIKVGYYFPSFAKKYQTGSLKAFVPCKEIFYMPIEILAPIETFGHLDVIVHKVTDFLLSDEPSEALDNLTEYLQRHPEVLLLDSIEGVKLTSNRLNFCSSLKSFEVQGVRVRPPKFYNLENAEYPCILKTEAACQVEGAHDMVIAFNQRGLRSGLSCFKNKTIIQEWIGHSGSLFKVYSVGNTHNLNVCDSIKFRESVGDYLFFKYTEKWPEGMAVQRGSEEIDHCLLEQISFRIQEITGLGVFGFDLVREDSSGDLVILDLNYFPSFSKFPDFPNAVNNYILEKCRQNK